MRATALIREAPIIRLVSIVVVLQSVFVKKLFLWPFSVVRGFFFAI